MRWIEGDLSLYKEGETNSLKITISRKVRWIKIKRRHYVKLQRVSQNNYLTQGEMDLRLNENSTREPFRLKITISRKVRWI